MVTEQEANQPTLASSTEQLQLFNEESAISVLKPASALAEVKITQKIFPDPQVTRSKSKLNRLGTGAFFLALGGGIITLAVNSFYYRWQHLVIEHGVLNGRSVSLQAPIDGSLTTFYARPGIAVKQGQVLALMQNTLQTEQQDAQTLLQLDGEITAYSAQLETADQALNLLKQQLQELEGQNVAVQEIDTTLQAKLVNERQAAVDAAIAKANVAKVELKRYQSLVAAGVISQQRVDQAELAVAATTAEVNQAQAALDAAKTSLQAFTQGVSNQSQKIDLLEQRTRLQQMIQSQVALINTLKAQLKNRQQQQLQVRGNRQTLKELAINAPFSGMIYRTNQEKGDQVSRGQTLLSLLDCQNLWVEAVISADDAAKVDIQQPVLVHLVGLSEPLKGEVDLLQPFDQSQASNPASNSRLNAIAPLVPAALNGQALKRITVRVPPPQYGNPQQFCGVGQTTRLSFRKKS